MTTSQQLAESIEKARSILKRGKAELQKANTDRFSLIVLPKTPTLRVRQQTHAPHVMLVDFRPMPLSYQSAMFACIIYDRLTCR